MRLALVTALALAACADAGENDRDDADAANQTCARRELEGCLEDDTCMLVDGYPVTSALDGSGNVLEGSDCVDMTGPSDPIGCVPSTGVWPTVLTCVRNVETDERRLTRNSYDALRASGWEPCESGVPPCVR